MRKIEVISNDKLIAHYLIYYTNMANIDKTILFYHLIYEYTKTDEQFNIKEIVKGQSTYIKNIYEAISCFFENQYIERYYSPVIYQINENNINISLNKGHKFSIEVPQCEMTKKLFNLFHAEKTIIDIIEALKPIKFQLFSLDNAEFFDFVPFGSKKYDELFSNEYQS
ncbi:hypothetical protein COBT_004163, partial [Conglomerata obtusa]